MHDDTHPLTILGLDPGTRFLGVAVLRDGQLRHRAVHELRNGERVYDLLGQARRIVFRYIERFAPQVVALEKPYVIDSERATTLRSLVKELEARSKELGLCVRQLSPEEVRQRLIGNSRATKWEIASVLVSRFPQLARYAPKAPKNPTLWLVSRDRYWLHMFDALAIATAVIGHSQALEAIRGEDHTTWPAASP